MSLRVVNESCANWKTFSKLRGRRPFGTHRVRNDVPMPRVELFEAITAPIATQPYWAGGDPGPIVAALASVPELLAPVLGFVGPALGPGAIGIRAKEIAILRTSALQGCSYCIKAHTVVALDVGLTHLEARALRGELPLADGFSLASDRALISWIDGLAGATGNIPDDVWTAARAHWAEHELIEACVTVGATIFLNRLATGLELPTAPGVLERLRAEGLE